jgi:hypothetical protein
MTTEELARLALAVLEAQQRYFTLRTTELLHASKKLERQLRTECERILAPGEQQPLF